MKKVTVYTSNLGNGKTIETSATTFGALQTDLNSAGVSVENMRAVIGETKVTLEHPDAALPEGDFKIFLLPIKTKSGNVTRKELYKIIKDLKENNGADYVAINIGNYTTMSTENLLAIMTKKGLLNKVGQKEEKEVEVKQVEERDTTCCTKTLEAQLERLSVTIEGFQKIVASLLDTFLEKFGYQAVPLHEDENEYENGDENGETTNEFEKFKDDFES